MFGRRRATSPDPAAVEEARQHVREMVLPGFVTQEDAEVAISEFLEGSTPLDDAQLAAIVAEVWAERSAEQGGWADQGDYDRVSAAFDDLERAGFVARMNFACCQNCGHAEIRDEATSVDSSYVFFHQQDTERLADDDAQLYLAFGVLRSHPSIDQEVYARAVDGDDEARKVLTPLLDDLEELAATQIVAAMERQGLQVEPREPGSRPAVRITDWRKRLPV